MKTVSTSSENGKNQFERRYSECVYKGKKTAWSPHEGYRFVPPIVGGDFFAILDKYDRIEVVYAVYMGELRAFTEFFEG